VRACAAPPSAQRLRPISVSPVDAARPLAVEVVYALNLRRRPAMVEALDRRDLEGVAGTGFRCRRAFSAGRYW